MNHPPKSPPTNGTTYFATTDFRGEKRRFGIQDADRLFHMYCLGRTGTGKSTLLDTFMRQDLERGHGFCLLDPHGDLAERVLDRVPQHRLRDVVYLNPADLDFPITFNVLESVNPSERHLVASGLISIFKRFWADFWGPRTEYLVRNALLALLESPGATLLDMSRLFVDDQFRHETLSHVRNPLISQFWNEEYALYPPAFRQEAIAPVQNKIGEFLVTPLIRNIVGQRKNLWHLRELMDNGGILIANLSKGRIGEDASSMLGSLVITQIMLAALSRQDIPEEQRRPFHVYVDECHSFATTSTYNTLLSEGRKFATSIFLANQGLFQLRDDELKASIFGNVASFLSFRIGAEDAEYISREFAGLVSTDDLINLDHHNFYISLTVGGRTSLPFSGRSLPPTPPRTSYREQIITLSRERYARPRAQVERKTEEQFLASRAELLPSRKGVPKAAVKHIIGRGNPTHKKTATI